MVMGNVGVSYVKAGQHYLLFSIVIAFCVPFSIGGFNVQKFVTFKDFPFGLPFICNLFIDNSLIISMWYFRICYSLSLLSLLLPCHFHVYQDGSVANKRLFLLFLNS